MCSRASVYFVVIQALALAFLILGMWGGQFQPLEKRMDMTEQGCLMLFGRKPVCTMSTATTTNVDEYFQNCRVRANMFRAAQVTAFIAIPMFIASCIIGMLLVFMPLYFYKTTRIFALIIGIIGTLSSGVTWALMVWTFHQPGGTCCPTQDPQCQPMKLHFDYGLGFGCLVAAWCLNTVNLVIAMLPCI